jgi:hypothetical protein
MSYTQLKIRSINSLLLPSHKVHISNPKKSIYERLGEELVSGCYSWLLLLFAKDSLDNGGGDGSQTRHNDNFIHEAMHLHLHFHTQRSTVPHSGPMCSSHGTRDGGRKERSKLSLAPCS